MNNKHQSPRARRTAICALALFLSLPYAGAQTQKERTKMERQLERFFTTYTPKNKTLPSPASLHRLTIDNAQRTVTVEASDALADMDFNAREVETIYKKVRKSLVKPYGRYTLTVKAAGMAIDELVPGHTALHQGATRIWGNIDHKGNPWTENLSQPYSPTLGLQGRHLSLWASHGRYYDAEKGWKWQRPKLFCTTEDLFTQTIVVPYLIPMLEHAGAVVFTPRERDWQREEIIIDNDGRRQGVSYLEVNTKKEWTATGKPGFALTKTTYHDGENPFEAGTARMAETISKEKKQSLVSYQPTFGKEGRYAVYVSYQTLPTSVDDALYTVWHKGIATTVRVNQQMGGGTWVYLGTYDFDRGSSEWNRVTVSNLSGSRGVVTTDAVRFGGGMGNIERGGTTSGLPRWAEGARYAAQWYGAPRSVVSINEGRHDYNDDINCRSLMENWLAGGSAYVPNRTGLGVPIELSLAMHSDDGYRKNGSHIGTLTICTTDYKGNPRLNSGLSRSVSKDYAQQMLEQVCGDLEQTYGITWPNRTVWDKNYNECRRPEVPSAIIEMFAHQNFGDLRLAHDPNFKFTLSRAVYKAMARFAASQHGETAIIQPLAPHAFRLSLNGTKAQLSWEPTDDPLESSANATYYIMYAREDTKGFDNGTAVRQTTMERDLNPGFRTDFRITAANAGGESFPSETLSAVCQQGATKTVLVVNGFRRLSSPAVVDTDTRKGFDLDQDPGVSYLRTAGWAGRQTVFDASQGGKEGPGALGYGGNEMAGQVVAGNTFDYVSDHAEAILTAKHYNVVSCSMDAVEQGLVSLADYDCVDLILGLEKNDGHALKPYKTFSPKLRQLLTDYTARGGSLLVSGSYIGSDMTTAAERDFLASVLKVNWSGTQTATAAATATGLGRTVSLYTTLCEQHYAATHPDALAPTGGAFTTMTYQNGQSAAVAYNGQDYRALTMGFPWECIKDKADRQAIMRGMLQFLLDN